MHASNLSAPHRSGPLPSGKGPAHILDSTDISICLSKLEHTFSQQSNRLFSNYPKPFQVGAEFSLRFCIWRTARPHGSVNQSSRKQRNLSRAEEQHVHGFMYRRVFFFLNMNNATYSVEKSTPCQLNMLGSIIITATMMGKECYRSTTHFCIQAHDWSPVWFLRILPLMRCHCGLLSCTHLLNRQGPNFTNNLKTSPPKKKSIPLI